VEREETFRGHSIIRKKNGEVKHSEQQIKNMLTMGKKNDGNKRWEKKLPGSDKKIQPENLVSMRSQP